MQKSSTFRELRAVEFSLKSFSTQLHGKFVKLYTDTLGYMTKTLNQIIFFFLHQNQNIFFSNIGNQNIFLEKNHNPSFKLNDRSLISVTPPPPFKLNGRSLSYFNFPNLYHGKCRLKPLLHCKASIMILVS
jgi:hypothetical protein